MQKSFDKYLRRMNFARLAVNNPKKAANLLRSWARGLENCKNTADVIYALAQILFLSTRTIERDISASKNDTATMTAEDTRRTA